MVIRVIEMAFYVAIHTTEVSLSEYDTADMGVAFFASLTMTSDDVPPIHSPFGVNWIDRISPVQCWK